MLGVMGALTVSAALQPCSLRSLTHTHHAPPIAHTHQARPDLVDQRRHLCGAVAHVVRLPTTVVAVIAAFVAAFVALCGAGAMESREEGENVPRRDEATRALQLRVVPCGSRGRKAAVHDVVPRPDETEIRERAESRAVLVQDPHSVGGGGSVHVRLCSFADFQKPIR